MKKTATRLYDPRHAGDADVVGIGDDLSPETLALAYAHGIFPWPMDGPPLLWFCPRERAVIDCDALHVPQSLAKLRRRSPFTFSIDRAFDAVVAGCQAARRPGQPGTWITPEMRAAYGELHRAGGAHSVEAWDENGDLAGGLYGVAVGGVFTGESLFYRRSNASKLALLFLIDHLAARGLRWLDIETMTPHMEALGAHLIPRAAFLDRLDAEQRRGLRLFGSPEL